MARVALSLQVPLSDVLMHKGQMWRAEGNLRGEVFNCQKGLLWITQQGDLNDYILKTGGSFWVTRPGTVLVEAVEDSRFDCTRYQTGKPKEVYAHLGYE
jgi:hypothetical protein